MQPLAERQQRHHGRITSIRFRNHYLLPTPGKYLSSTLFRPRGVGAVVAGRGGGGGGGRGGGEGPCLHACLISAPSSWHRCGIMSSTVRPHSPAPICRLWADIVVTGSALFTLVFTRDFFFFFLGGVGSGGGGDGEGKGGGVGRRGRGGL